MQTAWCINVYAFDEKYTKYSAKFNVKARTKPDDYAYTETEVKTWDALEERVTALEEGGVPDEVIEEKISNYLEENPINIPVVSVNGKVGAVELTAEDVGALPANTVIPSTSGLATEKYVDDAVAAIKIPETDLSNYYTKGETDTAITDAIGEIQPSLNKANSAVQSVKLVSGTTTEAITAEAYYLAVDDKPESAELITVKGTRTLISDAIGEVGDKTVKQYVDDAVANIEIPEIGGSDYKRIYYCDELSTSLDGEVYDCPQAICDFIEAYLTHDGDAALKVWGKDTATTVYEDSASIMLRVPTTSGVECATWDLWTEDGAWKYVCNEYEYYAFASADSSYITYDEVSAMMDERIGVIENGAY